MKHLRSRGECHVQLLAELILESCMGVEVNDKFFDMWKRMLKEKVNIDLGQVTIPQLKKELKINVNDIEVIISGINSSTCRIRVLHPTYTLITSLE